MASRIQAELKKAGRWGWLAHWPMVIVAFGSHLTKWTPIFVIVTLLRLYTLGLKETSKMKAACCRHRMTPTKTSSGKSLSNGRSYECDPCRSTWTIVSFLNAYLVTLYEDDMSPFLALLFLVYSVFDRVFEPEWVNIFSAWIYSTSDRVTSARVELTQI